MPARSLRILLCYVLFALCALVQTRTSLAQVAPRITIESNPPGALLYVDGAVQGQTGPNFKVRINKGQHRIRLELEGHKPVEQVVVITAAQRLAFNMEKAPARLDIKFPATNDAARGGEIYVDGTPAGTVPQQIDVPGGRHLIEIKKPGNKVYTETVEVKAGDTRPLWVMMQAESRYGTVVVGADANDAEVFVDGQPKGKAPVSVDTLNEGEHLIEVRRNEAGAPTWRQTVRVVANQQVKVTAQTAPPPPPPGSLLVISSTADAEVTVDGTTKGKIGQPLSLPPGQHSISVTAKGYNTITRVVDVEPGKPRIEKIDLVGSPESRGIGYVRIIMVTPMENAQYFVNGRRIDESAALSDQGVEVAAGRVVVAVSKDGFGQTKREVNLRPGTTEVVEFELRNVGKLYVATQPPGAFVILDRNMIGQTPLTRENVPAGPHTVEIQKDKWEPIVENVNIRSGEQESVSMILRPAAPPPIDKAALMKGLSSFSAVTIPLGHFTGDIGLGYPYFGDVRITVGVLKKSGIPGLREVGIDMGAEFRTNFFMSEVGANIRLQLFKIEPFSLGISTFIGGGGGPRFRNTVEWELGIPLTLLAGTMVKLTARPYLQVYSDRVCPGIDTIQAIAMRDGAAGIQSLGDPLNGAEHTGDRCVGRSYSDTSFPSPIWDAVNYSPGPNGTIGSFGGGSMRYNATDPQYQFDGNGVLERFTGVRFMLQAVVELAISPNLSIWALIEGAPNQRDRQSFTDKFNRIFPINETPIYGRGGLTLKF